MNEPSYTKVSSRYLIKMDSQAYDRLRFKDSNGRHPNISYINNMLGRTVDGEAYISMTPRGIVLDTPPVSFERARNLVNDIIKGVK